MRGDVLQDFVVPICSYGIDGSSAHLKRFFGTAFFVTQDGCYLTARHVIEACSREKAHHGIVVKAPSDPSENLIAELGDIEYAPAPWDVAIGQTPRPSRSWFSWPEEKQISGWKDVATLGYPESALNTALGRFDIHLRMLKGYVLRPLGPGDIPNLTIPDSFELSFSIPQGMSGSPLFVASGSDKQFLIGVCATSHTSEIVEHTFEEIDSGEAVFRERRVRAEQYGIAHSIVTLEDWKPSILRGMSLKEAMLSNNS